MGKDSRGQICPRGGVYDKPRETVLIQRDFAPSGFFALRTPLLPFAAFEDWGRGLGAAKRPTDAGQWERDRRLVRRRLVALLDLPEVREAIFLGSPSLEERMSVWRRDPEREEGRAIELGLVKYVSRMAVRCTPFGLFAGNSVGRLERTTCLEILDRHAAVRHTRLDMDFLSEVVAALSRDERLRNELVFSVNSSLYEVAGTLRYAEARLESGKRSYFLVDVEPHEHLRRALDRAREGASLEEIAAAIADDDVSLEEARSFVAQLVDAQMLVADLGPAVTGPESLDHLLTRLEGVESARDVKRRLEEARDVLIETDGEGLGASPQRYRDLAKSLSTLAPAEISRLVQVDLTKPAVELTLAHDLSNELLGGVQVLLDLFGSARRDPLEAFRKAFEERYGDREIALVEALDEELGIGFDAAQHPGVDPSPILAGLPFPAAEDPEQVTWGSRARFLEWKVAEAVAQRREEIVLDPAELAPFRNEGARLADAFHVMATILAPRESGKNAPRDEARDRDKEPPRAILDSAAGPSGARLLGRFCHGDPELRACVEEHLRAEEALNPGVTYFEIVHLPEGRVGNVLARPLLRSMELEYLGASGAAREQRLRVDDLTIRIMGNRVVLRSRSRGVEVRPRMTTAHNTAWRALGIYRFLAALQAEGCIEGITWTWGPLESQPRLPRVRVGRIVLVRQQWNVRRPEVERLRAATGHAAFRAVQEWRAQRGIPRWAGLVDSDNVLPIDFDQPLSVAVFLDELKGREGCTVHELFPGARTDAVEGPEGRFTNEIVVPVVRKKVAAPAVVPRSTRRLAQSLRENGAAPEVFTPGSEWLAVKLYTGAALADRVLTEVIAPLVETAAANGSIRSWFFIRYADPDWHLRVRFRGESAGLFEDVLPALHRAAAPFVHDRRIHRVQIDTYLRETARYGGPLGIEACEELFHRDSVAVLAFLQEATGDDGLDARWRFACRSMETALDDLGLDLARKHALFGTLARGYGAEFRIDSNFRRRMMDRYRTERGTIEAWAESRTDDALAARAGALLQERAHASRPACEELIRRSQSGELSHPLEEIAGSLLHMHANRILRSAQRAQEMVIHHFLESATASRLARAKQTRESAA